MTSKSSELFNEWANSSAPLYMQYYFWNVTNQCLGSSAGDQPGSQLSDDVAVNGQAPNVTLIGPFTYIEKRIKTNITFYNDDTEIDYVYTRIFYPIDVICTPEQYLTQVCMGCEV